MTEAEKTTMQIEKDMLKEFNKKKYVAMSKKGMNLSNNEFLGILLEAYT